jgi:hypothetical protein
LKHVPAQHSSLNPHWFVHDPQWSGSLWPSTSQPFVRRPSQSSQPATHGALHAPATHAGTVCAGASHALQLAPHEATESTMHVPWQ